MAHIHSRSPYFVTDNVTNLASANLELYIYTGKQTVNRPSSATYNLYSTAINEEVVFDIGQLINDKIQFINDGTYRTDGVWVDYQITRTLVDGTQSTQSMVQKFSVDGYNYYTEGANYDTDTSHLLSIDSIRVLEGEDFEIAINRNYDNNGVSISQVSLVQGGLDTNTVSISNSDLSGQVIYYYSVSHNSSNTGVKITFDNSSSVVIPIVYESECKYTPKKITFINRFGAMEDIWFFKASKNSLNTERKMYQNNNIISGGTYNIQAGQNKVFNITSKETMTLNTGFLSEQYNEAFTQLMHSENVWVTEGRDLIPVIIKSEEFAYKTALNDKMINYTIDVEYAFNKMNTVR